MADDRTARSARAAQAHRERERAVRRRHTRVTVATVASVVTLVGIAWWGFGALAGSEEPVDVVAPGHLVEGGFRHPGGAGPDAPVVEVYADSLCPHCGDFEEDGGRFLAEQAEAGAVDLRFRPMAVLDGAADEGPAHDVMNAAVCAADLGGAEAFWTAHAALFAARYHRAEQAPSVADLTDLLGDLGPAGLAECIEEGRFIPWIDVARRSGRERGVAGTPTVVIDGRVADDLSRTGLATALADR